MYLPTTLEFRCERIIVTRNFNPAFDSAVQDFVTACITLRLVAVPSGDQKRFELCLRVACLLRNSQRPSQTVTTSVNLQQIAERSFETTNEHISSSGPNIPPMSYRIVCPSFVERYKETIYLSSSRFNHVGMSSLASCG